MTTTAPNVARQLIDGEFSIAGGATGSLDARRTVPREYGNEIYVLSVPIRSPTACHID